MLKASDSEAGSLLQSNCYSRCLEELVLGFLHRSFSSELSGPFPWPLGLELELVSFGLELVDATGTGPTGAGSLPLGATPGLFTWK